MTTIFLGIIPLDYTYADVQVFETEGEAKDWLLDEKETGVDVSYAMIRKVEV